MGAKGRDTRNSRGTLHGEGERGKPGPQVWARRDPGKRSHVE